MKPRRDKPDLEQIRADRRRAQRAAEDALATVQEAGRTRADIERGLAESEREVQQHLRVLRRARLL